MAARIPNYGVTLPGAGYPSIITFSPPVLPNPVDGMYALGGSAEMSCIDRSGNGNDMVTVGNPEMITAGATVGLNKGFETPLPNQGDVTFFAVVKIVKPSALADSVLIAGCYLAGGSPSGSFLGIERYNGGSYVCIRGTAEGASAQVRAAVDVGSFEEGEWAVVAGRLLANGTGSKVYARQGGVLLASSGAASFTPSTREANIAIGNILGAASAVARDADISLVAVALQAMNNEQMEANVNAIADAYNDLLPLGL